MESPCTSVCSIDIATGFCRGCGRTGDEIASWTLYSDRERRHIMSGLHIRIGALGAAHRPDARGPRRDRMPRERAKR
ncbi:hypothetical protein ASG25_11905 [Rhizobium sp. Leaf384]|uniref:DUF1289 domain-containing protein n=1 Tax=unclassified Rhizobium TaxID=2613769 RepID=UPI00071396AB|nr:MULTISPECIES: DUF1289 domain-containing protein [unclassified Rhizobium]KQR68842.1 hypothetical protein ASG03_06210 [Rhizobium sp. Leaf341]KQS79256.1 hypothetical protein ASG25_11905 [Rhizobium sp. Leaf384]KQS82824.1 hypothetical protein ASG58_05720 [Rhizobium sp. Leaf383]